jgi:hypothetical protein
VVNSTEVVDAWGNEKKDYDYAGNSKAQVWVCQYSPPGNYVGERPY